jgi:hypothetical protein
MVFTGRGKRHPAIVFIVVLLVVAVVCFGIGYIVGRLLI